MTTSSRLGRTDADAVRVAVVGLGFLLGAMWVIAIAVGSSFWLTWMVSLGSLACFGTVALVPERRSGFLAAGNLGVVTSGLTACWLVALALRSSAWLSWCCFGAGCLALLVTIGVSLSAAFDRFC